MDSFGTLTARVSTGWAQTPVENASVSITSQGEKNRRELLCVRTTNESGIISQIILAAPDRKESLSPSPDLPFAQYNVQVSHEEYQTLIVENVQIFPGVESTLPLHLIPLPFTGNEEEISVDIFPQNL